jgi:hypothetical protein
VIDVGFHDFADASQHSKKSQLPPLVLKQGTAPVIVGAVAEIAGTAALS